MERKKVQSTNIVSIGYDEASETLEIEFKGNSIYQYFKVSVGTYQKLMHASSKGIFASENIKDKYKFKKIK